VSLSKMYSNLIVNRGIDHEIIELYFTPLDNPLLFHDERRFSETEDYWRLLTVSADLLFPDIPIFELSLNQFDHVDALSDALGQYNPDPSLCP
jgi:hypothetical protein